MKKYFLVYNWSKRPNKPDFSSYYDDLLGIERTPTFLKSELSRKRLIDIPKLSTGPGASPTTKQPRSPQAGLPPHYVPYLIVGAGPAGMATAMSVRASDPSSHVLLVSNEAHIPYLRPALSKEVWRRDETRQSRLLDSKGDMSRHSWLFYEPSSFFLEPESMFGPDSAQGGVALLRNSHVVRIDPERRMVQLADGNSIYYGQCCIATGGRPKRLYRLHTCDSSGRNHFEEGRISYYKSVDDYVRLRDLAKRLSANGGKIVIVGGGFLGCELAYSLALFRNADAESKLDVTLVIQEDSGPLSHTLPPELAQFTRLYLEEQGVRVRTGLRPMQCQLEGSVSKAGDQMMTLTVDQSPESSESPSTAPETGVTHVIVAVGVEPNTDLADTCPSLEVDSSNGGFLVNSEMEAVKGVFVAGDVSSFYDPLLGRRRVEHQNHAEESGHIAGMNMAANLLTERGIDSSTLTLAPTDSTDSANATASSPAPSKKAAIYKYQSSMWSYLGVDLMWDAVGLCDPRNLHTHAFFSSMQYPRKKDDENKESQIAAHKYNRPGVVFYLRPNTGKIVGILLWNLPEELYHDQSKYAPSRLQLARSILANQKSGLTPRELSMIARDFDLDGTIDEIYQRIKEKLPPDHEDAGSKKNNSAEKATQN